MDLSFAPFSVQKFTIHMVYFSMLALLSVKYFMILVATPRKCSFSMSFISTEGGLNAVQIKVTCVFY